MSDSQASATEVQDFEQVIETTIEGRKPLIVGGHAVNIWALAYRARLGPSIERYYPFTSKDLDLYGTMELLGKLHQKFGGTKLLSEPRNPVIGSLKVLLHGVERKIEVLHSVKGLLPKEMEDAVPLEIGSLSALVLSPQKILKAKICNVATLNQQDRNDVKHLHMIILCLREFIKDYAGQVISDQEGGRLLVNLLEEVRLTIHSPEADKALNIASFNYESLWPVVTLAGLENEKVANFLKYRLKK